MTAAQLREIRTRLGLTQSELASRLRVDPRTIRKWEAGDRQAPPYLADAIEHMSCRRQATRR